MEKRIGYTLSDEKEFFWYIESNSIIIEKKFTSDKEYRKFIFDKNELISILEFIEIEEVVELKNNVAKMKHVLDVNSEHYEYCKKGLGPFVYKYSLDNYKAQTTSQLVAILYNIGMLDWNHAKKSMKFWLKEGYKQKLEEL